MSVRKLADVTAKTFLILFDQSWQQREAPVDWRKANVTLIFKKGKKEDPGNCRLVSFTSIPAKAVEQLILETTSRHTKHKKIMRSSQHGFTKWKSCLTNFINFFSEMTGLVRGGRAVDTVYLDFSKALDTVSRKLLIHKLLRYRLDEQTVRWFENRLNGWA